MELKDYLSVVSRRRWWIILTVVIVTAVAVAVSLFQAPSYRGQAQVLYTAQNRGAALLDSSLSGQSDQPERDLQTQIELIRTRPVAERVIRALGLKTTPEALIQHLDVSANGQTNIVTIAITDKDPELAAKEANAFADASVESSRNIRRSSIKAAADQVERSLSEAQARITSLSTGRRTDSKQSELEAVQSLYNQFAEKLQQLKIALQLETGSASVVSSAVVDPVRVSPIPLRNGALGLSIGLLLGLGAAFVVEALDTVIKSSDEAAQIYSGPVLAAVPAEKFAKDETRRLTVLVHPGSPAAEAYRGLRNGLNFINFENDIKTLLVASAEPGEGKSTVAANLAAVLSQAGWKVTLVICDFRRPTSDQFFLVNHEAGLSDVLAGMKVASAVLQKTAGLEDLKVLTAGKMPPNPSEMLGSAAMGRVLTELKETADWIILDTPPLLAVADAAAVARWADGVLVVTRSGVSTRDAAKRCSERLAQVGARIVGVVVVGGKEGPAVRGYHGYSDGSY